MNLLANPTLEHVPAPPADGRLRYFEGTSHAATVIDTDRRSNHAPTILALRSGGLLAAWFGGSDEGNKDIDVLVSKFDPNTAAWSESMAVTHDEIRSDQNPGLFEAPGGAVWLVYTSQLSRQSGVPETFNLQHTSVVKVIRTDDDGATWSEPELLFDREGTFCRQPIQVLSDGRWVHSQWLCFDDESKNGSDQPVLQISDDEGVTWRQVEFPDAAGRVHPNVVELEPGRLVCLFRSRFADWVYLSRSEDGGDTWTVPEATEVPNNNAGLSAFLLPSRRLALVSNEHQVAEEPGDVVWPYERMKVVIAVSQDEGRTWPVRREIEPGDGFTGAGNLRSNRRQEYPHGIVDSEGLIHVVYAYSSRRAVRHVVFAEDWISGVEDQVHTDCKLWG
ncbi:Predicted neuraminidase (sialidase) [Brevibacterium sandarakinum]|uniref:Predicted neuraminidase (Sialidase) n=1 Tax=Brevibacterium sandarakinum TaxID=629680 RepID=A0A1H1QMA3_BRESA|nr:sialidase family protein [Brevibacterium sandarakinum]SDS24506.1 Predicted neuraminidase (sialidase) [Brevibacterium sandarakinum]